MGCSGPPRPFHLLSRSSRSPVFLEVLDCEGGMEDYPGPFCAVGCPVRSGPRLGAPGGSKATNYNTVVVTLKSSLLTAGNTLLPGPGPPVW